MKIRIIYFVIILSSVLLASKICYSAQYEITTQWKNDAVNIIPIDIDGDGTDELLVAQKRHFMLKDQNFQTFWQINLDSSLVLLGGVDVNKDGIKEIFARLRRGNTEFLLCFNSKGEKIKEIEVVTGKDIAHPKGWDGAIFGSVGCLDANDDGKSDVVLTVGTSFDLQPRGVYCFDFGTGKEIWHFFTGPKPEIPIISDVDGDGYEEIIFGSSAPGNGNEANNTDDSHSYVFVLDRYGKLLWKHTITGGFSDAIVRVADIDGDSKKEVIVTGKTSHAKDPNAADSLFIFDGKSGKIERIRDTGSRLRGIEIADLDHNGKGEIIAGTLEHKLRVFNHTLNEVKNIDYESKIELQDIVDLNGDGAVEIIALTGNKQLVVFNEQLEELFKIDFKEKNNIFYHPAISNRRKKKFLLSARSPIPKLREFTLLSTEKKLILTSQSVNFWLSIILFAVLSVIFIAMVISQQKKLKLKQDAIVRDLVKNSPVGILIFDERSNILEINQSAENMLHIKREDVYRKDFRITLRAKELEPLKHFLVSQIESSDFRDIVETSITLNSSEVLAVRIFKIACNSLYCVTLQNITHLAYTKRVANWAPVAQKLAHGIKNPLSHIRLAIQQLTRRYPDAETYSETVLEEVNRLIKLTDGFMKFTNLEPPKLLQANLNEIIENLIKKVKPTLPENLKIELILTKEMLILELDFHQIEIAITNILDNAFTSIGEKGFVTIKTICGESIETPPHIKPYVELQITDTGMGIPEEYISKLFEPYFTTRPEGTGLGLSITKKIVEDHNGTIDIQSKKGLGTTVTMRFFKEA